MELLLLGQNVVVFTADIQDSAGKISFVLDCTPPNDTDLILFYDMYTMSKLKWVFTDEIDDNSEWVIHQTNLIDDDLIKCISECDYVVGPNITFHLCVLLCTLKKQKREYDFVKVKKIFDENRYMICPDLLLNEPAPVKQPVINQEDQIIDAMINLKADYLKTTNFEITKKIIKVAIQINNLTVINKTLAQDKMYLMDYNLGLHYATSNTNFELAEYFLNQKVIPHFRYLAFMTCCDTVWADKITNIYKLFSAYLCPLTHDAYDLYNITMGFENANKLEKQINWCNVDPQHKAWYKRPGLSCNVLCDAIGLYNKNNACAPLSIQQFIKQYGFQPSIKDIKTGIKNGTSNLILYLYLEHGYRPDLVCINGIDNLWRKILAYKYFFGYTVDYAAKAFKIIKAPQ